MHLTKHGETTKVVLQKIISNTHKRQFEQNMATRSEQKVNCCQIQGFAQSSAPTENECDAVLERAIVPMTHVSK
jgi:hypothetical protein